MTFIGTTDFYLEVKKGNVAGHSMVNKFGRNPDIDIASGFEAIWNGGGDYTGFDATAVEAIEVLSSSANDTGTLVSNGTATGGSATTLVDSGADFVSDGVAVGDLLINDTLIDHGVVTVVAVTTLTVVRMRGASINASGNTYRVATPASTGVSVVRLDFLLDSNYAETSEYVILNGLTGVNTSRSFLRNSRIKCIKGGSNNSNVGTITSRQSVTTANIFAVLPIGNNQTMIAAYTIPAGKRAFIMGWFATLSKKQTAFSNVRLIMRDLNELFQVKEELTVSSAGSSYFYRQYIALKEVIQERSDIKIMADSSANDNGMAAGFDIMLIDI